MKILLQKSRGMQPELYILFISLLTISIPSSLCTLTGYEFYPILPVQYIFHCNNYLSLDDIASVLCALILYTFLSLFLCNCFYIFFVLPSCPVYLNSSNSVFSYSALCHKFH